MATHRLEDLALRWWSVGLRATGDPDERRAITEALTLLRAGAIDMRVDPDRARELLGPAEEADDG